MVGLNVVVGANVTVGRNVSVGAKVGGGVAVCNFRPRRWDELSSLVECASEADTKTVLWRTSNATTCSNNLSDMLQFYCLVSFRWM